jgi:hypothetical protein
MADETLHPAPLLDPQPGPLPQAEPEPEPVEQEPEPEHPSTHSRLRAFEELILGPDHVRPHDKIERGIGSPFSMLSAQHKAHHAALEALIAAEAEHKTASAAEEAAHAKLEAAIARATETEEALNPAPAAAEPTEEGLANG